MQAACSLQVCVEMLAQAPGLDASRAATAAPLPSLFPALSAAQINEEAELHNRLLDDLDEEVDGTRSRLAAAQRRLKLVMRRSGSCKTMTLMFLIAVILVVVLVIGFKVALHLAVFL